MNLKVSRSELGSVLRGFPAAFGPESEFSASCCYFGVCGGTRIPIGDQMQLVMNVNPETFAANQIQVQPWPVSELHWVH
jgi:hypothetical protein